jgi:ABC-type sulfate/molybdate transport systems ATPase subunit
VYFLWIFARKRNYIPPPISSEAVSDDESESSTLAEGIVVLATGSIAEVSPPVHAVSS